MNEGNVVLAPLPQANGAIKNRPAVVLRKMPPFGDLLVCGVSSQIRHAAAGFDDIIDPIAPDFAASGLKTASVIRLGFLAVLPPVTLLDRLAPFHRNATVGCSLA